MKIAIGIDTGGTYTDAVVYDFEKERVLCAAKAPTTRENLSVGICGALDGLEPAYFDRAELVALSTTLTTNACVENKGGRAKLLLFGIDPKVVDRVGSDYGLWGEDDLFFVEGRGSFDGKAVFEPDWDELLERTASWMADAESLGIVEIYAINNGAVIEKKAREKFSARYNIPVICGHELYSELNSLRRAASTFLNARLIPVINEFLDNIKLSLAARGITAPVAVVRSDCSLMSEEFARVRPVTTILCGPAASVLGGQRAVKEKDMIIVDTGGTTTDISLVKDGVAQKAGSGIQIGSWKTFVKGVFIDTFGLGGDSAVRVLEGKLTLFPGRVLPISAAASRWPGIISGLEKLLASEETRQRPSYEYFSLVKSIDGSPHYTEQEKAFCSVIRERPLRLSEIARALDADLYMLRAERLEREGVVLRCGLTPTDIMHIKGDFTCFDLNAARLAARFAMQSLGMEDSSEALQVFCDMVYDKVKETLCRNIVRVLLQDRYESIRRDGLSAQLEELIGAQWEEFRNNRNSFFTHDFSSCAVLTAIGAPTHIFLPDVAKALGAVCVVPENAAVSNAIGAAVGKVTITETVNVSPVFGVEGVAGYRINGADAALFEKEYDTALRIAEGEAKKQVRAEALLRGMKSLPEISVSVSPQNAFSKEGVEIFLGTTVVATGSGGLFTGTVHQEK